MQEKVKHLDTLENRLDSTKISPIKIFCRNTLIELIKGTSIPNRGGGVICFNRRWVK
jgi:hypothetical protein